MGAMPIKFVECAGFALTTGAEITVKFTKGNTAESPTLSVNGTITKPMYYRGSPIPKTYLAENSTYTFRYDGTHYDLVGYTNFNINKIYYGICSTAADTAEKFVPCPVFELVTGAEITAKFTKGNTAESPTLNVNRTGAKPIYYRGSPIPSSCLAANGTYTFRYDGTNYDIVGDIITNNT